MTFGTSTVSSLGHQYLKIVTINLLRQPIKLKKRVMFVHFVNNHNFQYWTSQSITLPWSSSAAVVLKKIREIKDCTLFGTLWSPCVYPCPMISPPVFPFSPCLLQTHTVCGIRIQRSQNWIFIKLKSPLKVYLTAVYMGVCRRLKGLMTWAHLRLCEFGFVVPIAPGAFLAWPARGRTAAPWLPGWCAVF